MDTPHAHPPRLLDRVRLAIRARHYSRRTGEAYAGWIRRFIVFHEKRHPSHMGEAEIGAFLAWLADARRVSASTQSQGAERRPLSVPRGAAEGPGRDRASSRAKAPVHVPVVMTGDEVRAVLQELSGVSWLVARCCTEAACGFRSVSSCA